jgi:hypothetical protein
MAGGLGDLLWWFGWLLGGGVWIALLALAYSAGPIDEAVFWASLIGSTIWLATCIWVATAPCSIAITPTSSLHF